MFHQATEGWVLKSHFLWGALALAFLNSTALAQVNVPATAQPGRAPEQLQPQQVQPSVDLSVPNGIPAAPAPAGSNQVKFLLKTLTVQHVTVYKPADLEPIYRPYLGKEITLQDLYNIAAALTDKYRRDGYILSQVQVPTQDIKDGNVVLEAREGFIGRVRVQTAPGLEKLAGASSLRHSAQRLEGMKPLTKAALERNLLLLNDLPGMHIKAVVKASADMPNAADLYLLVTRQRITGYVETDNRGSRYLGPWQFQAGMTVNQVFDEKDAVSVRAATAYQPQETKFGELGYRRRLMDNGLTLQLKASTNPTRPGYTLKDFDVRGTDQDYQAGLDYPLIRTTNKNLNIYGKFEARNVQTNILDTLISKDDIRAARVGGTFTNTDKYLGSNLVNLEMSHGLKVLGASDRSDPVSHPAASPTFTKFNATASREQFIRNSGFSLYGALTGQYATDPLYAAEEFGLGGEQFGSGYDPSEITGDSGAAVRLEGRYAIQHQIPYVVQAQPYAFYDVGFVHNRDPGAGLNAEESLASAGVGIRVAAVAGFAGSLEVAEPLTRQVAGLGNDKFPRVFFKLSKSF
jgi:hemolysin activation/secretion protein